MDELSGVMTSGEHKLKGSLSPEKQTLKASLAPEHQEMRGFLERNVRTSNYENLANKPMIEGITLQGNQTFEDLSLVGLTNKEIEDLLII